MVLGNGDQTTVREYLLGHLSDDEQEHIEQRLMVEDDLFEELEISKGELIEEYRAGELAAQEKEWFERHFLASPEGRERYTLAVALGRMEAPAEVHPEPVRPTLLERLASFFKQPRWAIATVIPVLAAVIVAVVLLSRPGGQTFVGPTLASTVITRSGNGPLPTKVALPPNSAQLKLRLMLPQPSTPDARYEAKLDDKVQEKQINVVESDAESVSVLIPVELVPAGEYSLSLRRVGPDGRSQAIPGYYLFNVE
jgi:hypothetical protein